MKGIFVYDSLIKSNELVLLEASMLSHIYYLNKNFDSNHTPGLYYAKVFNISTKHAIGTLAKLEEKGFINVNRDYRKTIVFITDKTKSLINEKEEKPNTIEKPKKNNFFNKKKEPKKDTLIDTNTSIESQIEVRQIMYNMAISRGNTERANEILNEIQKIKDSNF